MNDDSEASISTMHILKYKPIYPDIFTASKNNDVDS